MGAMVQRTEMRFAIESAEQRAEDAVNIFYLEGSGATYYGCEVVAYGTVLTWYFVPTGEKEGCVFLYIHDNCFDDFIDELEEGIYNVVCKAWPLLMDALVRGVSKNYTEPVLIRLPSIKDGSLTFWCLAMKVENIDMSDVENWASDYVKEKVKRLVAYLKGMTEQLSKNEPSKWGMFVEGVKNGFKILRVWKLLTGVLPVFGISPIINSTLGDGTSE